MIRFIIGLATTGVLAVVLAFIFGRQHAAISPAVTIVSPAPIASRTTVASPADTMLDEAGSLMRRATNGVIEAGKMGRSASLKGKLAVNEAALPAIDQAEEEKQAEQHAYFVELRERKQQEDLDGGSDDLANAKEKELQAKDRVEFLRARAASLKQTILNLQSSYSESPIKDPSSKAWRRNNLRQWEDRVAKIEEELPDARKELGKASARVRQLTNDLGNPEKITKKWSRK